MGRSGLAIALIMLGLTGCSSGEPSKETPAEQQQAAEESTPQAIKENREFQDAKEEREGNETARRCYHDMQRGQPC